MAQFFDELSNQETWGQYFHSSAAKKYFDNLVDTKFFRARDGARAKQGSERQSESWALSWSRAFDFSGGIANACWADEYKSIAQEFPNFTSVILVKNPEQAEQKLAGAFFLAEGNAVKNNGEVEPILVIRGLNPKETVINSLEIEDFYNKVVEYSQDIAQKTGRKLAIACDDHSGGCGTNRPALFDFLESKVRDLKKQVKFDKKFNGEELAFNDYNIAESRSVFYVDWFWVWSCHFGVFLLN